MTGPPDWVGIGAMKAGSTWWHDIIVQHPRCRLALGNSSYDPPRDYGQKEVGHFNAWGSTEPTDAQLVAYHRHFPRIEGTLVGESTPTYMAQWWVPDMLARVAPDAKVIAILRDPVDRYEAEIGHYLARPDSAELPIDLAWAHWHETAFLKGLYGALLEPWKARFGDRLLVLQYRRCVHDFDAQAARTYAFLGVEDYVPENRYLGNRSTFRLSDRRRAMLGEAYAADVARLAGMFPDAVDVNLWEVA